MIFSPKFAIVAGFTDADLLICQKILSPAGEKWNFFKRKEGKRKEKLRHFLKDILLKLLAALIVGDNCVWENKSMLVKLQTVR